MKTKSFKPERPTKETDLDVPTPTDICHYEGKRLGLALKQREPAKYDAIVAALSAGNSLREVASEFGVSKNTAGAIALRELGADHVKRAFAANLARLVHCASEQLLERLDEISPTQLAVVLGIASDKLRDLAPLRDQPLSMTQINVSANISDEAVARLIAAHTKQTQPPIITIEA